MPVASISSLRSITPTSIGGLPTTASSLPTASVVSHLYYAGTILSLDPSRWNPIQVLLVKGLETGSSSGWFVRGIPGARDLQRVSARYMDRSLFIQVQTLHN